MTREEYDQYLLDEFSRVNSSVEIVNCERGDENEPVPAHRRWWLRITTREHGWLHLYLNYETAELEWY